MIVPLIAVAAGWMGANQASLSARESAPQKPPARATGKYTGKIPIGVIRHEETLVRSGGTGDNWDLTWGADGHQYTALGDGTGWGGPSASLTAWRIKGGPHHTGVNAFTPELLHNFPPYLGSTGWFGHGIISVDGTIYLFISVGLHTVWSVPYQGAWVFYSRDNGTTWFRHDEVSANVNPQSREPNDNFFWHADEDWTFSFNAFVQHGQDNRLARDKYVYIYSPSSKQPHYLHLARAPRDKILKKSAWQYFVEHDSDGTARWTSNFNEKKPAHTFRKAGHVYSYHPSVVYNKPLDLYIMTTYSMEALHQPNALYFLWSKNPWGPWTKFHEENPWHAGGPRTLLYQPKLSPKWISRDGTEMYLIFSDYMDKWTTNYKWNQQKITLKLQNDM
ncbi:MAG: DUF4185 domain-containing protein [Armatimonadetes bacterium]|nr:DUF4185 domain-containing protein [Armatimonadota bacterium]